MNTTFLSMAVALIATIVNITNAQMCGFEISGDIDIWDIRETHPVGTPFASVESYNIGFVRVEGPFFTSSIRLNDTQQIVDFFVTEAVKGNVMEGPWTHSLVHIRCNDGTIGEAKLFVAFKTENISPPQFNQQAFIYNLSLPWPIEIPITLSEIIIARDKDILESNNRVDVYFNQSNLLRVVMSSLVDLPIPGRDIQIDLFVTPALTAGAHTLQLIATDGVYITSVPLTLYVTETACRTLKDPVFGSRGSVGDEIPVFYKASLKHLPNAGEILHLDGGQKVEAYDPDNSCQVEIQVGVDYLKLTADGQLMFTRALTEMEVGLIGSTEVIEISAKVRETGKSQRIPLVISFNI